MSGIKTSGEDPTVALSADVSGELPAMGELLGGRYELLGLIGVGGMGSVYRARDAELEEVVALKTISRDLLTSPAVLERFRQEVKLARRVTHKNVARMFDIGEHKSLKFLTMELVDGESLGDRLQRDVLLSVQQTAAICKQICAGLGAAHEAGIVHRDLKPDNVMLAKSGRVLITDFGIARAMQGSALRTQGMPVGTPAYMAPEQIEGVADVDARADIYALGVMLYEMLVGAMPFEGDSVFAVAAARLVRPPPNPQEKNPSIPNPIAAMVVKCMQRRREDRYASAADVAAAFEAISMPAGPELAPSRMPTQAATSYALTPVTLAEGDGRKIVAVLPFKNMGSVDDAHLAEGLTEDLVDALSMAKGVRVRSRGATQNQADKIGNTGEIGRALGVQVIVDGTLRRAGDTVRATIRLVSVEDGLQLWAKRFERPVGEVLRIGDEAATAIASALTAEPAATAETITNDPVAIDLFLRGRQEYHRVWHDANTNAIDLFARALERAPNDPKIMGAYALALARRYAYEFGAEGAGEQAVEMAQRTLALAPRSSAARTTLAVVRWNQNRVVEAAQDILRALKNGPANGDAHDYLARVLLEVGLIEEAIDRAKMALIVEARLNQPNLEIARGLALLGRWDEAWARLGAPPQDAARANAYWATRVRILSWNQSPAAIDESRRLLNQQGPFETQSMASGMLDTMEDLAQAGALASILKQFAAANVARRRTYFSQVVTELWCKCGDIDNALTTLEYANGYGLTDIAWIDRCPSLAPLRSEERFARVRAVVRARAEDVIAAIGPELQRSRSASFAPNR